MAPDDNFAPHMHEITTSIDIDAPADRVWQTLIDFPSYAAWNPFIRSISGSPHAGSQLEILIVPPDEKGMRFRPRVLRATANRELRWLGRLFMPGIFDGEHFFQIEPLDGARRSRFVQGERFRGLLVPFLRKRLDMGTRQGFEAMNRALKSMVESQ